MVSKTDWERGEKNGIDCGGRRKDSVAPMPLDCFVQALYLRIRYGVNIKPVQTLASKSAALQSQRGR